jgi:deoxyadenosine/deoxycytidine kinase
MKRLIFVNGTMGVGKTSTCKELLNLLQPSVFLDGDWCWYMNPFQVTDETKQMVQKNISFLLNNFLACTQYENVIFSWVMQQESIMDHLLGQLNLTDVEVYKFTLAISREALAPRLSQAIKNGERTPDVLQRSMDRLALYRDMNTVHIDVSNISQLDAARLMIDHMTV